MIELIDESEKIEYPQELMALSQKLRTKDV